MTHEWFATLAYIVGGSLIFMALCLGEKVLDHYWPIKDKR